MSNKLNPTFRPSLEGLETRSLMAASVSRALQPVVGPIAPQVQAMEPAGPQIVTLDQQAAAKSGATPKSLVGTVNTFTITNESRNFTITFSIRWSPREAWKSYTLARGAGRTFWHPTDRDAEIRFDHSIRPGFQEQKYSVQTKSEIDGRLGPTGKGQRYVFRDVNSIGIAGPILNGVDLYKLR